MANNGNTEKGESEATLQSSITTSEQSYENIRTLFSFYLKRIEPASWFRLRSSSTRSKIRASSLAYHIHPNNVNNR